MNVIKLFLPQQANKIYSKTEITINCIHVAMKQFVVDMPVRVSERGKKSPSYDDGRCTLAHRGLTRQDGDMSIYIYI